MPPVPQNLTKLGANCGPKLFGSPQTVYYAKKSWFTTISTPPSSAAAATLQEIVEISDDHVFGNYDPGTGAVDYGWQTLELTPETGEVKSEMEGERGSKKFMCSWGGSHPGNKEEATALLSLLANCEWIFLVPEYAEDAPNQTVYRQIGNQLFGAYCEENIYINNNDAQKTSLMFKGQSAVHAPYYKGAITVAP